MKFSLKLIACLLFVMGANMTRADEGMWIPSLLKKYKIEDLKKAGFKLTAEDVYNVNQACLKDAVVGLGSESRPFRHFCTGEIVSGKGLLITNHHCGYRAIQSHSSIEHDYLKDGFWAMNQAEELPNEGITASFLIRIDDVTSEMMKGIVPDMDKKKISEILKKNKAEIIKKAQKGTHYKANVKAFFSGNQYFLSVYEIYKDVRLVGAPPSAIGKFGGDTDNWMWPRHTGDFSMFRIYADKNNMPASYSKDNVPLKPKRFFEISLDGVNENDFTMVFGYPGTTTEYLTSYAIEQKMNSNNPHKIKIRTKRLNIMGAGMDSSQKIRIQYSAKYAGVANAWKKWQGEIKGLKRIKALEKKEKLEQRFREWAKTRKEYDGILDELKGLYASNRDLSLAIDYIWEAGLRGCEILNFSKSFMVLAKAKEEEIPQIVKGLKAKTSKFFKDFDLEVDKNLFEATILMYSDNLEGKYQPQAILDLVSKNKNKFGKYTDKLYEKSIFTSEEKVNSFLNSYKKSSAKKVLNDPIYKIYDAFYKFYRKDLGLKSLQTEMRIDELQKKYMAGLMEMDSDKIFYPDANSTFRFHYGKVKGFKARNAVYYDYYTSLDGIIEKDNPEIFDYDVPQKLKELYASKDYGRYANEKGEMPVCFAATNHTTGGNSGSPILNAEGQLIGVNFDRAWEGVMSDLMYDPSICRNVCLDIRYVLFVVDKFAGAGYLLDEMKLVSKKK
ncbi:MAG: S46 family peptidase [Marinifilaceae bacterium]|nr:S46 family peptidase [Marinifilaceae bacterium]